MSETNEMTAERKLKRKNYFPRMKRASRNEIKQAVKDLVVGKKGLK